MDRTVVIGDLWLTLILGSLIPLATELLTQRFTTGWPKALVLVALSAFTATAQWVQARHGVFTWADLLASFLLALATAFTTHNTLWKPTKITGDDGIIQRATGGIGLGGPGKVPELVGPAGADVPPRYAQGGLVKPPTPQTGPDVGERVYSADELRAMLDDDDPHGRHEA